MSELPDDDSDSEFPDDEPDHCVTCNGSGEGQYDGSRCWACRGKGVIYPRKEDDDY